MGAYGVGDIKLLSSIVKPEIGILTGINEQHLALFGSQENIINTKYELIESLPEKGLAIFNGDNKYCRELYKKTGINRKIYSISELTESPEEIIKADIWAENIKIEKEFVSFTARTKNNESAEFRVNALGIQSVLNLLAAILTAKELSMDLDEISKAAEKITSAQGAMKVFPGKENINIIDSSYSANSDGAIADLEYLKIYEAKKIIVMPCLIELGYASSEVHRAIGRKIGEVCTKAIITTKECFEEIKAGAIEAGMAQENISFMENPEEIAGTIAILCTTGDAVLLEGRVPKGLIDLLK
jgi:UDP-N-acetylmuramoyl-tripeptide--D-alanyl-D-alanine ligase